MRQGNCHGRTSQGRSKGLQRLEQEKKQVQEIENKESWEVNEGRLSWPSSMCKHRTKSERKLPPKDVTIDLHISKGTLSKKEFCETSEPSKMALPDKDPLTMKATCESVIKKDKVPSMKKLRIRSGRKEQRQDQLTKKLFIRKEVRERAQRLEQVLWIKFATDENKRNGQDGKVVHDGDFDSKE